MSESGPMLVCSALELQRLHELPHAAVLLYLLCLRRYADSRGVVGRERRLSERMFVEVLTVPAVRGRHAGAVVEPSRKAVRSAVDALVAAGLAKRSVKPGESLVFRLPLAVEGRSVSRMRGQVSGQDYRPVTRCSEKDYGMSDDGMKGPMRGLHQGNIITTTGIASHKGTERARDASLPEGVRPEAWALYVDHHRELRRWSAAREVLALGHLREIVTQGGDGSAVLEWAAMRGLSDLRDAWRRMRSDAARQDGVSLANAAVRTIREAVEPAGNLIPFPGNRVIDHGA